MNRFEELDQQWADNNQFAQLDVADAAARARGPIGEIAAQGKAGLLVETPQTIGQSLQYVSEPGRPAYQVGQSIADWAKRQGERPDLQAHPELHNAVTNALAGGARMIGPSVIPPALVGAGLVASRLPIAPAAELGIAAFAGALPAGLSQGQQTLEKAQEKGVDADSAREAARRTAAIEWLGETLGTYAGGKLFGIGSRIARGAGPAAAAGALEEAAGRQTLKPFAKQLLETALTETATEVGQNAGEAAVERAYGIDDTTPYEAGIQAIAPTLGMTALLAPLGLVGFGVKAQRNRRRAEALSAPDTDPGVRQTLAQQIGDDLHEVDPTAAQNFRAHAANAIAAGQPLAIDASLLQTPQTSANAPQTPANAQPVNVPQETSTGPLTQAADIAQGQEAAQPTRYIPFATQEAAQKRADFMTEATGEAHVVGPHPENAARFAAMPQALVEAAAAATKAETPTAGEKGAVENGDQGLTPENLYAADQGKEAAWQAIEAERAQAKEAAWQAVESQRTQAEASQTEALRRDSLLPKDLFNADVARRMDGGEPLQTAFQKAFQEAQQRRQIDLAAHEAATSPVNETPQPSAAQKAAGNYRMGHPKPQLIQGLPITIENPQGSTRSGADADGNPWQTTMPAHYGYIRGTEAADGHKLDVFLGPYPGRPTVYVVDQLDPKTGQFDEHKAMVGFDNPGEAEAAYRAAYQPGWQGFGGMTAMSMPAFKQWIKDPANLKTQAGASHAETLPSDAGRIRQENELRPSADQGGESLQRDQEAQGAEALQPTESGGLAARLPESAVGTAAPLAPARYAKAAQARRRIDPARDSLFTAIGKLGGLNQDEARKTWGLDPKDRFASGVFGRPVLTRRGQSLDAMAQALANLGYLPRDEHGRADIADLEDAFSREHAGRRVFTPQGVETQAEARAAGAFGEFSDADLRQSGFDTLSPAAQDAVAATFESDFLDMGGRRMNDAQIENWLDQGTADVSAAAAAGTDAGAASGEAAHAAALEPPGFQLSGESAADIARREAALTAQQQAQAANEEAAAAKAQADRERDSFSLTGSDRPADANPQQEALFGNTPRAAAEAAPQTPTEKAPSVPEAKAETARAEKPPAAATAGERLAQWVTSELDAGRAIGAPALFKAANAAFEGTQAQGKYTPKDAYDALELGVNQYLAAHPQEFTPTASIAAATRTLDKLGKLLALLPTQSKRTGETDEFQQFSTPPTFAYVANWAANIQPGERYLEPSAGVGGLAVFGKIAGAKVIVNELSPRRAALLQAMGFEQTLGENAEQLHNVLPDAIKPTVIVMNPPFSATAGRVPGARETMNGARHIEQALKRLEPNGRLVAIVGEGMAADRPAFRDWWRQIRGEYNVRANIGIEGKGYAKYGTTFNVQLLVIDKTAAASGAPFVDKVATPADALPLLEAIRNERISPSRPETMQPAPSQPAGATAVAANRVAGRAEPGPATPSVAAAVGGGGRASGSAGGSDAGRVGRVEPNDAGGASGSSVPENLPAGRERLDREPIPATSDDAASRSPEPNQPSPLDSPRIALGAAEAAPTAELTDSTFEAYRPQRLSIAGAKAHPGKLVQSAAMAAVEPPAATYRPQLPPEVITQAKLSLAQLESVVYAGQAFEQTLPDGARRGFFIGDGTGVGKGREISGVILDSLHSGENKAVWMSEKQGLMKDAKRDFAAVGGDADLIFNHNNAAKYGEAIKAGKGVLFTTYATLRVDKAQSAQKKGVAEAAPSGASRLRQIVDWLGKDFSGVIVFDEAHNAGNAIAMKGPRGVTQAAAQALKVMELQDALPKARILYVSATGATEVSNLSYAKRLGLWGPDTAFPTAAHFINQIDAGGLAAMELVARDMKQMGVYLARSLSYDGVTYSKLEHQLTPLQTDIYNELARAWQTVLKDIHAALRLNQAERNASAKSAALSAFWGAQQRFFNQVLTAMQMPAVIGQMHKDLQAGHAVVLQLVNTNEAAQNRQLAAKANENAQKAEAEALEDLDLTPREQLIQYVQNAFPIAQYEEYVDDNGNRLSRPVVDASGNPVFNKDAIAMRDQLIANLRDIRVPDGPLEIILNEFGHDQVAEITGRGKRVVRQRDKAGDQKLVVQTRSRAMTQQEAEDFQNDKRRILVFSDAGGTGFSFQSDLDRANQRRRMHYLIQPGWRADKAVQGFGRTHRTNQANAPHYYLPTTNLPAQKRFISSIARRLDQLGALTKGQREATNQGLFSAKDNLESRYAEDAITGFFNDLYRGNIPGMRFGEVAAELGFDNLIDKRTGALSVTKLPSVPQFLNRLLSLTTTMQDVVFAQFVNRMDALIDAAIANGTLDTGMQTLRAKTVRKVADQVVYTDAKTNATTRYVDLELTHDTVLRAFASVAAQVKRYGGRWVRNAASGKVWAEIPAGTLTKPDGAVLKRYRFEGVTSSRTLAEDKMSEQLEAISEAQAQRLWEAENAARPQTYSEHAHMIVGSVLPIWDRLGGYIAVARAQTVDGERVLGRLIHPDELQDTLKKLGASSSALARLTPAEIMDNVLAGKKIARLANDWTLSRARVANEYRVEIGGVSSYDEAQMRDLQRLGVIVERIGWQHRFFVPVGETGQGVLAKLLETKPLAAWQEREPPAVAEPGAAYTVSPGGSHEKTDNLYASAAAGPETGAEVRNPPAEGLGGHLEPERAVSGAAATTQTTLVVPVKTGELRSAFPTVKSAGDAAHVFAYLRKSAQERFDVLVLDKDDKPLALLRLFAGAINQTNVYPGLIAAGVYQTPGAASVWLAHNHPSGDDRPSKADIDLTRVIANSFGPDLGVELKGHVIIAGRQAFAMNAEGDADIGSHLTIAAGLRQHAIPVMERRLRAGEPLGPAINAPKAAAAALPSLAGGRPGVVFVDARNQPTGFLPMAVDDMRKLRTGDAATGFGRLMAAAGRHIATGAFVYLPPFTDADTAYRVAANMQAALNGEGRDIRFLDAIYGDGQSWVQDGPMHPQSTFFSRRGDNGRYEPDRETARLLTPQELATAETRLAVARRALARDARSAPDYRGGTRGSPTLLPVRRLTPGLDRVAERVREYFGREVVYYSAEADAAGSGFFLPQEPNLIYLNVDGGHALWTAAGHELLHALKQNDPLTYRLLDQGVGRLLQNEAAYREALRSDYAKMGVANPSNATAREELIAEVAERFFNDEQFWKDFDRYSNPSAVQRVLLAIGRWFQKLLGRIDVGSKDALLQRQVIDIDAARQLIARAYAEFAGQRETAIRGEGDVKLSAALPPPLFYSELKAKLAAHKQAVASPEQWTALIKNLPGVKADEIQWSGVNEWLQLQGTKVTREQVLDYLREGGVQVDETIHGEANFTNWTAREFSEADGADYDGWGVSATREDGTRVHVSEIGKEDAATAEQAIELAKRHAELSAASPTKFEPYQLPGGKRYRELLLTLPHRSVAGGRFGVDNGEGGIRWFGSRSEAEHFQAAQGGSITSEASEEATFRSSHFTEPNILAHVRFNERTDADGKRVLFIEELQSDWAQQGKREGFAQKTLSSAQRQEKLQQARSLTAQIRARSDADRAAGLEQISDETLAKNRTASDQVRAIMLELERDKALANAGTVPSAPFVTKTEAWTGLAIKRMIRYAAENGFDRIAWTTGEQQAARYDLSKPIEAVAAYKNPDGTWYIQVEKDGAYMHENASVAEGKLEDLLGKDLAKKIIEQSGNVEFRDGAPFHIYSGLDLKVGGEGMRAFYDQIVPNVANEVLKKLGGGRVRLVSISSAATYEQLKAAGIATGMTQAQLDAMPVKQRKALVDAQLPANAGFDITPALREKALGGLPLFSRSQRLVPNGQRSNLTEAQWRQVRTPEFKAWFGDWQQNPQRASQVVDENGEPRVVYHGTHGDFTTFAKERIRTHGLGGFWFAERPDYVGNLTPGEGFSQMPVFLNIRRPVDSSRFAMAKKEATTNQAVQRAIRDMGGDGVRLSNDRDNVWIALEPNQIKSAMANAGGYAKDNPSILFSRRAPREAFNDLRQGAQAWLSSAIDSDRSIGPLMRSVNTQYHKAEMLARQGKPEFKRVFDLGQQFISDKTLLAAQAAQLAPDILHQPKSLREIAGGARDSDLQAIDKPLNEGTLYGGGDPLAGIRWSDEQLRRRYSLSDTQIKLYREYLDAAAESVDIMAKAQIAAHARTNDIAFDRDLSLPDMAANVVEALDEAKGDAHILLDYASDQERIDGEAADLVEQDRPHEADQLRRDAERMAADAQATIDRLEKTILDVNAIARRAQALREAGYKPLMRFGEHTVTAHDEDGKVAFYGMYEGNPLLPKSGEREAKSVAAALAADNPDWSVTTGVLSQNAYKLYAGVNLEALQLFADHMDEQAKEPYQEYLRQAVNNRSALKRMIHRQGTPGFSTDARRTLAQFVLSNGRLAAAQYHLTEMRRAAEAIPQAQGDIKDEAVDLHEYLTQPKEEASKLRGFLFFNYLGGSLASAMVNLTQVPAITAPYLAQHTSYANGVAQLVSAAKLAVGDPAKVEGALGEALRKAEADGVTAPQEIYQLMAIASNSLFAGAKTARFALQAWGKFFSAAEQFNRRTTFIAAYRIAVANGQDAKAAFAFAESAVNDTQFIYNKGNRPNWARGAIGATVFTFKQFNLAYLELFKRLPWKQRAMMLGTLTLFAGAGGLPFEEDLEDLIDTLGQWLGFATNAKRSVRRTLQQAVGDTAADALLHGVSAALPFDISGRMGMANLIPATAILKPSEINKARDVAEAVGPIGSLIQSTGDMLAALATGHFEQAALAVLPTAARNAYQGVKMAAKGYAEDASGRKTLPVSETEAAFKAMGFQPSTLARFSEIKQGLQQERNIMSVKQEAINARWAEAVADHDSDGINDAKRQLIEWNHAHPDMPLRFDPAAIRKRVVEMQMQGDLRYLRSMPKGLRREAVEELR